jgi:Cys-tRNA(Pro) deacylase
MIDLPPVARALDKLQIPYRLFAHAGPVRSLEQAARERNQLPDQVIRSIVFRVGKDEFLMVLMAGDRQISWPVLRRYLGQSRLTLATEVEVRSVTGYERGAVAPFGLPQPLRLLVDESVFVHDEVSLGSGVRGTAVIMTSSDLRRALGNVEIVKLGEE